MRDFTGEDVLSLVLKWARIILTSRPR
ncbi:unnamed protein product [Timema podura]|uniref:Uncharacterized protein n=1 Tax=Timema podura TaxID=61482 RepID=A0ABN7PE07_TIMPD|nr:unnamed protein product [Timema podura]